MGLELPRPIPDARLVARLTRAAAAALAVQLGLFAADLALAPDMTRAERSSPVALDRRGAWLRALPVENGRWRVRADLERTDPAFLSNLLAVEDAPERVRISGLLLEPTRILHHFHYSLQHLEGLSGTEAELPRGPQGGAARSALESS